VIFEAPAAQPQPYQQPQQFKSPKSRRISPSKPQGMRARSPIQNALEMKYRHPYIQPVPHISDKSRRLALQRRPQTSQQLPVHERLHHQELEKTKLAAAK